MGLDIFTYTKEQQEASNAFDDAWGDEYPDKDTQPERYEAWHAAYRAVPSADTIKSERFPDNINEKRYLRSSYNGGGFNNWVPNITRDDRYQYYWVFEPVRKDDDYLIECTDVDLLLQCRERAVEIVDALEEARKNPVYNVTTESPTPLGREENVSAEQALRIFDGEKKRNEKSPFGSGYSNRAGAFWPDDSPLQLVAAVNGRDVLGQPALHLIYKSEFHESYLESAYVLVEFCEELISLVKADGAAYIHWSG